MTTPLSDERLAEIRAREQAATLGPWKATRVYEITSHCLPDGHLIIGEVDEDGTRNDATFIAAARQDVPDLLAEVERLRACVAELDEPDYPLVRVKVRWDDPVLPEVGVIAVWARTTLEDLHRNLGMNEPGTVYEVAIAWCPVPEASDD